MKQITFNCPACDFPLTVPASAAGLTGPCPECGEIITGPGLKPEEDPAPGRHPAPPKQQTEPIPSPKPAGPIPDPKPAGPIPDPRPTGPIPDPRPTGSIPDPKRTRPIPEPAQPEPPAAPSPRQFGLGTIVVLVLLSSAACFSLGYQLGRSSGTSAPPQDGAPALPLSSPPVAGPQTPPTPPTPPSRPEPAPPEPAPPEPAPSETTRTPEPAPTPVIPPIPAPGEELTPEKAALLSFLSAADWTARRKLVLHPDHVASQMESFAANSGDGPVTPTKVNLMHRTAGSIVYEVATAEHPNGFPVALKQVDDRWLVDWESFAELYYKVFEAFVSDESRTTGTFRVLIKPELAGIGDTGRQPYSASAPNMEKPIPIYAAEDSEHYQTLEDIIGALAAKSPRSFRQLMETGGIPLVLELTKTADGDKTIIMIERIVRRGWSPRDPDTTP